MRSIRTPQTIDVHEGTSSRELRRAWWPALLLVSTLASVPVLAENWPHWRGPNGSGVSPETKLPESWTNTENIAWRTRLSGSGVSSPVVWGDRVYTTSQAGEGVFRQGPRLGQGADASAGERSLGRSESGASADVRFVIDALHRATGVRLWTFETKAEGEIPAVHDKHNLASASPVTDGERVVAVFGSGQVVAVDTNGRQLWTRHLAKEFGVWSINWGNGSSPVVHGTNVIVQAYHQTASYLIALDLRTGAPTWKTDRPGHLSYSTPIVVPGPAGDELIVNSSVGVEAFDPRTGTSLWNFAESNQFPIPVAMHHDGVIYLSRGYRSGPFAAIRPGGRGEISKSHVLWHVPTGAPYVASLVHYEGLLYMAGDVGVITAVDAKTGERVWRERLGGIYTASPVAGDGKIYLLSEDGETIVLRAGRSPQVIARNRIAGRILASPALSQGRLFIRTDGEVVAIGAS